MDYYEILQIHVKAEPEVVKGAWMALTKKYHPDVNDGGLKYEEKMKRLNEAYGVLRDPVQRAKYDKTLNSSFEYAQRQASSRKEPKGGSVRGPKMFYHAYPYDDRGNYFTVKFPAYRKDFIAELKRRYTRSQVRQVHKEWVIDSVLFCEIDKLTSKYLNRSIWYHE